MTAAPHAPQAALRFTLMTTDFDVGVLLPSATLSSGTRFSGTNTARVSGTIRSPVARRVDRFTAEAQLQLMH